MTANYTPRLHLMAPTNSDTFTPDDFTTTFGVLDQYPGVRPVASYAALPTGLTNAQHGSMFVQTDNQAMWMWNKPTPTATGSWIRTNTVGLLGSDAIDADKSTSATDDAHAATIMSIPNFPIPGGRRLLVQTFIFALSNSGTGGIAHAMLLENGSAVTRGYTNSDPTNSVCVSMYHITGVYAQGTQFNFSVKIRGFAGTHGGGTTTAQAGGGTYLQVYEI
jgi:hypothetical protein